MSTVNTFLSCPEDCATAFTFPALTIDQDCTTFDTFYSQVGYLYIIPDGANDPLDWTDPANPAAVSPSEIDNTNADNTKVKMLVVQGELPVPDKTTQELPLRKTRISGRTYTLSLDVPNMTDANREFLRNAQCNPTNYKFYYANVGGNIFGPQGGITPTFTDADLPLGGGRDDFETGTLLITFESSDGDPPRYTNPLA